MHIHEMPPVWLDQIPLRPKAKSEELDFEKLREAAAQEAERLSAEREKQNRQSSAQTAAVVRRQTGRSRDTEEAELEAEYPAGVATLPIKINLLA